MRRRAAPLALVAAIGFFRFLARTRFWLPPYLHWLAAIALLIGIGMLWLIPADAPVNQGSWVGIKHAMVVLFFPAVVYVAFVFYGGQHAAYQARLGSHAEKCPRCREGDGLPGHACSVCGQKILAVQPTASQQSRPSGGSAR